MNYTIPKPAYPLFLKLLAALVITGLVGLGIVAFETFSLVHGPVVAAIFAIVIEVGAAIDSIGLAGGINRRSWWLIPAILITIIVSGWYNFATVAQGGANLKITDANQLDIVLHAIAWGPLASLAFMALGVGFKISDHERAVKQWEANRQAWLDDQAAKTAQTNQEQETRRMQLEYQKEKLRLDNEAAIERARAVEQRKVEVARARIEARAGSTGGSRAGGRSSRVEVLRGTYQDFVDFQRSNGANHTNKELAAKFGVTTRTITEWRAKYQAEHAELQTENN